MKKWEDPCKGDASATRRGDRSRSDAAVECAYREHPKRDS